MKLQGDAGREPVMRIDSNQAGPPVSEGGRTSNPAVARNNPSASAGVGGALGEDQAQLSDVQVHIQALVAQAAQLPETTQPKIDALRQAVVNGSYQPKPDQVAEALMASMVKRAA
jgi:flagellar biosynthesis anti-sigma factor FlgM